VAEPERAVAELCAAGFDATSATSSIAAVEARDGARPASDAAALMRTLIFVPAYPELPAAERSRLLSALQALA
jgi:perosamine synthetase